MRRVFIDTNILLDLLLERQPWVNQASALFSIGGKCRSDCYQKRERLHIIQHTSFVSNRVSERIVYSRCQC